MIPKYMLKLEWNNNSKNQIKWWGKKKSYQKQRTLNSIQRCKKGGLLQAYWILYQYDITNEWKLNLNLRKETSR